MADDSWLLPGASKDAASITPEWSSRARLIDGVIVREVKNVPKKGGHLTELFRRDWFGDAAPVGQVFQNILAPRAVSAWHAHASTTDRLFVAAGLAEVALFDNREASPTRGELNIFQVGTLRPALIVIPPRVWHGVQNIGDGPAILINMVDAAYDYDDPDHWRIPSDSPDVPHRWAPRSGA